MNHKKGNFPCVSCVTFVWSSDESEFDDNTTLFENFLYFLIYLVFFSPSFYVAMD